MKHQILAIMAGIVVFPGVAFAEMITGTLLNVDASGGSITLERAGTEQSTQIRVMDKTGMERLQKGSVVTVDAKRKDGLNYETYAVPVPAVLIEQK